MAPRIKSARALGSNLADRDLAVERHFALMVPWRSTRFAKRKSDCRAGATAPGRG
jgi:hypothetical protein